MSETPPKRILIVDDDPSICRFISESLLAALLITGTLEARIEPVPARGLPATRARTAGRAARIFSRNMPG